MASIRALSRAPDRVADRVAGLLRNAPEQRLEQLMRSPARRIVLDAIFWQMPQRFDRRGGAGMDASIRWCITGRPDGKTDTYQLQIVDGRCRLIRGSSGPDPKVTITVDGAEFLRLATGSSDPMKAYFSGRIKLGGDVMVAAKLTSLFRIPSLRQQPSRKKLPG
jgi:predicted lipid carrier protein YhbT